MARHMAALLAYLAVTVAFTWPLSLRLGSSVPQDLGDPLLSIWTLWWNATVLPLTDRWWNGPIFFPATDTLALSDHRIGLGIISTPILWLGASAAAAHNVVFLASFVLSAAAAYALGFVLTRHHGAAFLGGLIFAFNPFRADHLAHLELLCAYWLPIALLALHRWGESRRPIWLVLLSGALTLQAITSAYYFAFFGVLAALWIVWYLRPPWRLAELTALAISLLAPVLLIAPILMRYWRAHGSMGLARTMEDVERFSADLVGLVTAPQMLALWNTPAGWNRPEGALYPGAVAVAIAAAGLMVARREAPRTALPLWARRLRRTMLSGAAVAAAGAAIPILRGPVALELGPVRLSISQSYKPLSLALLLVGLWLLTTGPVRQAWRARSALWFYALATLAMWLFALGPTGHVFRERFLYKAPYSWLMLLPGVDTAFRVPARFGMLAALTLSAAAALAWRRLVEGRSPARGIAATALAAAAITADSWIEPLPLRAPPAALQVPTGVPADAVVLELPLGAFEDAAAMYRAIEHRRPIVNGLSGYAPPSYQVLHSALAEGRLDVLAGLTSHAPLLVVVDREAAGADLVQRARALPSARLLRQDDRFDVFLLPRVDVAPAARTDPADGLRMAAGSASVNEHQLPLVGDCDRHTGWSTPTQQGIESLVADLGGIRQVEGIVLGLGAWPGGFPRAVAVLTSADGTTWEEAWNGDVAALALRTAIADQRDIAMRLPFRMRPARYIRVRQIGWSALPWRVAEFRALVD